MFWLNLTLWSAQYWAFRRISAPTLEVEIFPTLLFPSFSIQCTVCELKFHHSMRVPLHLGSGLDRVPFPQLQWHSTSALRWCHLQMKSYFLKGERSGQILQWLLFLPASGTMVGTYLGSPWSSLWEPGGVPRTKACTKEGNLPITMTPGASPFSCWPTLGLQQFAKISSLIILLVHMVYGGFWLR